MMRTNAFIFDLDGTLVDSLQDIANALNGALAEVKLQRVSLEQVRGWVGDGLPMLCRRAAPNVASDTHNHLVQLVQQHYRSHCTDNTRPYPKVLQMLDLLKDRSTPMAVLSNKPHAFAVQVVDQLGLGRYFGNVCGYMHERDKKPAPEHALRVARQYAVEPSDILFVGDSVVDIQTARNAGMIAVAVTWGLRSRFELAAAKPDYLVHDPMEIPRLPGNRPYLK